MCFSRICCIEDVIIWLNSQLLLMNMVRSLESPGAHIKHTSSIYAWCLLTAASWIRSHIFPSKKWLLGLILVCRFIILLMSSYRSQNTWQVNQISLFRPEAGLGFSTVLFLQNTSSPLDAIFHHLLPNYTKLPSFTWLLPSRGTFTSFRALTAHKGSTAATRWRVTQRIGCKRLTKPIYVGKDGKEDNESFREAVYTGMASELGMLSTVPRGQG